MALLNPLKYLRYGVGAVFIAGGIGMAAIYFGNDIFASEEKEKSGQTPVTVAKAGATVVDFRSITDDGTTSSKAGNSDTQKPGTLLTRSTQSASTGLTDAEQQLFQAALERETQRATLIAERAMAAMDAPLGESVHDIYSNVKQRRAARLAENTPQSGRGRSALDDSYVPALREDTRLAPSPEPLRIPDLKAGTVIAARLLGDVRSELPGTVRALVTNDVFDSKTLRRVIVPQGSQLLGSYDDQTQLGQKRLFIYWTKLQFQDGRVFDLQKSASVDASGASGLAGRRQTGFFTALVQGALIGTVQNLGRGGEQTSDLASAARIATGQSTASVLDSYIGQRLSRGPRFTLKAGTVLNVMLDRPFSLTTGLQREGNVVPRNRPQVTPPVIQTAGSTNTQDSSAFQAATSRYDRTLYGSWIDSDGDCINTRHEVLAELSTGAVQYTTDGCAVVRGRWLDPYTGQIERVARDLDVDHLVPLAWAHPRGGATWDSVRKMEFANDPRNLFATKAAVNRAKGAKGPLDWLPPSAEFHCEYITRFERIVRIWSLEYRDNEVIDMAALRANSCA
jgi:type IV secretory pathway VirB10-like protein